MSAQEIQPQTIAVLGGGAAGFFAAINIAEKKPAARVLIFEKSAKVLQKVKVSGGGRCNVTNACYQPKDLSKNYPRGGRQLLPLFQRFQPADILAWFKARGVVLKTESDNRVFPVTDNSQTIIDCFLRTAQHYHVEVKLSHDVVGIRQNPGQGKRWLIAFRNCGEMAFDDVVVATGGTSSFWNILEKIGHRVVPPVPSLFTFNIKDPRLDGLQGVSFPLVRCRIAGSKFESEGPLLITHWGLSGPAILKLSAWAARELNEMKYRFDVSVNFTTEANFDSMRERMMKFAADHAKKLVKNAPPISIATNYWRNLLQYCLVKDEQKWGELGKKHFNKFAEELCNARFSVVGKSTFKEEFVTCGGVDLSEVDMNSMESKKFPGLYFAGEVLDIDAITGGFNFQAAWTTAWVVSESLSLK